MATTDTTKQLTLVETAKRIDPNGQQAAIAEVLAEENEILWDAPWREANDTFSNKTVRRASLPSGSWRKLNAGVATESSGTIEVIDTIGMLESYSEVDKDLADSQPNPRQFRSDEDMAFVEGLGQSLSEAMVYANALTDPEKMTGLAPRMSSLATSANVLDASGSGSDVTSIYVVMWGLNRVHMIYPRNTPNVGIRVRDLGEATKEDGSGNLYQVYRTHFQVKCGLVVRDPKSYGRIANIESSGSSNIFDEDDIITLLNRMRAGGRGAFLYVNDTIKTQMEIALKDKSNVFYTAGQGDGLGGEDVLRFKGRPVRMVDQIVNTETAIT